MESSVNVPLLRKAVEWVEEQEALPVELREWDQGQWSCETGMCVAGYLCHLDGWQPGIEFGLMSRSGVKSRAWVVAADLLGIADDFFRHDGDHLFDPGNTAADIRRIAEELAGERL